MKSGLLNIAKFLLFLFIGIGLLWMALRGLDFEQIWDEFRSARYFWLVLVLVPGLISHLSRAARWNIMINSLGYKTGLFSTFHAVMMGYFANIAVPRLGEITRCTVLSKRDNIPLNSLLGTVIAERLFDTICLILIAFVVIISQFGFLRNFLEKVFWSPVSAKLPSSIWLISLLGIASLASIALFLILLRFSKPYLRRFSFYSKMKDLVKGFAQGLNTIRKLPHKRAFYLHTVLIWSMYFLMTYLPLRALDATSHLTFIDGTTLLMMGTFAFVVPVPAGIGAYHWIITKTLTDVFLIEAEPAATFALMVHASQIFLIVLVGMVSFTIIVTVKNTPHNAPPSIHPTQNA